MDDWIRAEPGEFGERGAGRRCAARRNSCVGQLRVSRHGSRTDAGTPVPKDDSGSLLRVKIDGRAGASLGFVRLPAVRFRSGEAGEAAAAESTGKFYF